MSSATLEYSGKVRDIYGLEDGRLCMVTSDRISAFDVVMDQTVPDKGRVLTAMSAFWFEQFADARPRSPAQHRSRRPAGRRPAAGVGRAGHGVRPGRDAPRRVHRPGLPHRARPGRSTSGTGPCTASRCRAGLLESAKLPEPVFTPSTKAAVGDHDENISFAAAADLVGAGAGRATARRQPGALPAGRRLGRDPGHRDRRHQVRDGARRRRVGALRRGADARLVTLLVGRRVAAGINAAVVRQAAGARLPRRRSTGTRHRRRRRCPTTSSAPPRPATAMRTSASPTGRSTTGHSRDGPEASKGPAGGPAAGSSRRLAGGPAPRPASCPPAVGDHPRWGRRLVRTSPGDDRHDPELYGQTGFEVRFAWGPNGLRALVPGVDAVVVVDVLSFTTAVDVAVERGAVVLPYKWRDGGEAAFAEERGAVLAVAREDATPARPWTLAPSTLLDLPAGTRLVLPSPNGSALSFAAVEAGAGHGRRRLPAQRRCRGGRAARPARRSACSPPGSAGGCPRARCGPRWRTCSERGRSSIDWVIGIVTRGPGRPGRLR